VPVRRLLAALVLTASAASVPAGALSSVEVPVPTLEQESPPPSARACTADLDSRMPVVSTCPVGCYRELWDGPLLYAENRCDRRIWITYEFVAVDGREYRTPCYALPAGVSAVVPEPSIGPQSPRRILVAHAPGLGHPTNGFRLHCADRREPIEDEGAEGR
jgi:hypothetical protein